LVANSCAHFNMPFSWPGTRVFAVFKDGSTTTL
jgi:hypothetical protein